MLTQVTARHYPLWFVRVLRISLFTVLIAIAAKIAIPLPGTPVPITTQVLAVLLAGMTLGPVEGAISVLAYLAGIAIGLPIDAYSLGGAALVGPTAGYLIGFFVAAIIAGLAWHAPQRSKLVLNILLGLLAAAVVEVIGTIGLVTVFNGSWLTAFTKGMLPFIFIDFG